MQPKVTQPKEENNNENKIGTRDTEIQRGSEERKSHGRRDH